MTSQTNSKGTKVLSVRLSKEEATSVDKSAASIGLNRNDYIRMKLFNEDAIADIGALDELVFALRQIERAFERYLDILEGLPPRCGQNENEAALTRIVEEINRAEAIIDLVFKVQKQTINVLRRIRRRLV